MKKNSSDQQQKVKRHGLQTRLGIMFSALLLLAGAVLVLIGYRMVAGAATSATDDLAKEIALGIMRETIYTVRRPAQPLVNALAHGSLAKSSTLEQRLAYLPTIHAVMRTSPILHSIFIGFDDGDFFMVRALPLPEDRRLFAAPPDAALMVLSIQRNRNQPAFAQDIFYDEDVNFLSSRRVDAQNYDPRTREWYKNAMGQDGHIETPPYRFFDSGLLGTTFAQRSRSGKAVIGADITLSQLSEVLARELPTPGSQLILFRPNGDLIATAQGMFVEEGQHERMRTPDDFAPIVRMGMKQYQDGHQGHGIAVNDGEQDWFLSLSQFEFAGKVRNVMLLAIPEKEILANARHFLTYTLMGMVGILFLLLPLVWFLAGRIAAPLRALAAKAQRIQGFYLDDAERIESNVTEICELSKGMDNMQKNIKSFLDINCTLNAEQNFDVLLERLIQEILSVSHAQGGLLTLLDQGRIALETGIVCWHEHKDSAPRVFALNCLNNELTAVLPTYQAFRQKKVIEISITREDPRSKAGFLAPGFSDPAVTRLDVVCVPLSARMGEHLGVLALFKPVRAGETGFPAQQIHFIKAIASSAGTALENQSLIEAQRKLRDALVHILAGAIDAKSPYTGGHCQRVPAVFQMLLHAACDACDGPLKDFTLDEDEWEEAKLAGWLHDCGKVTTPEYVVDKATKLQTINDRIHELRTRFEVLKRDAEIVALRAVIGGADEKLEQKKLDEARRKLDEEFAFVANCNLGSEYMSDEDMERLTEISSRTWWRTLDKRLGVSREERKRMDRCPPEALPVEEKLIADLPEHIIERVEEDFITPDNPWNFKVTTPQVLYNRGEFYNLCIRRGTLTEEERYKINDHIVQTIIMLSRLPLIKQLRNIPEIAGAHHETMDGKGYPRRLTREQMSWSARMMAIADIFEALTASDRPYKASKTLSETLKIMDEMVTRNHIDPDLYKLFLDARIPQRYADHFLSSAQNDM